MAKRSLLKLGQFFLFMGAMVFVFPVLASSPGGNPQCGLLFEKRSSDSLSAYTVPSVNSFYAQLDRQAEKNFQDTESFSQHLNLHNIQVPENEAFVLEVEKHASMILEFLQGKLSQEELPFQGLPFLKDLQESMGILRSLNQKTKLNSQEKSTLKYHRQSYHTFLRKMVVLQERIQKAKESHFRLYPVIHVAHYYLALISMDHSLRALGGFEYNIDLLNHKMESFFNAAKGFAPRVIFTMKQLTEEDFLRIRFSGVTLVQANRFLQEDDSGILVLPSSFAAHDWEHGQAMVVKDQGILSHIGWSSFLQRSQFFDLRMKYFLNYLHTNMPKQVGLITYWMFTVLHDDGHTLLDPEYFKFTRDILEEQLINSSGGLFTKKDLKLLMKQYDRLFENRWQRRLQEKFQDLKYKHLPDKKQDPDIQAFPKREVGLTIEL